jgi:hypothetical protein
MLGLTKSVAFDPYGRRRSGLRIPRWLLLLLIGIAAGVGGVLFVQERYLPPRLSAADTVKLRSAYESAEATRLRQKAELDDIAKRLENALTERQNLSDELAMSRSTDERLRGDLSSVVSALPPDPRGASVEVRSGQFAAKGNALNYDVVLTRARNVGPPTTGVLQLVIAGNTAKGTATTFAPPALAVSIEALQVLRGSVAMPDGFRPQQATIQVLDRRGGKLMAMRVLLVK